jgi:hypothetical protein
VLPSVAKLEASVYQGFRGFYGFTVSAKFFTTRSYLTLTLHDVCSSVRNASISGAFFMNFSLNAIAKHMFFSSVISLKNLLIPVTVTIKSL